MIRFIRVTCIAIVCIICAGTALDAIEPTRASSDHHLLSADQLAFSTLMGGSDEDWGRAIVRDTSGNIYVTGMSTSDDLPTTQGAYCTTHNGGSDVFVTKFDANGSSLLWSTYIGGSGREQARSIAIDSRGNVVVSGLTSSSDFPVTAGCYDGSHNGGTDVFVLKLSVNGTTLMFATFIGGSGDECGEVCLDAADDIYIAGDTYSSDFPTTVGAYDRSQNGAGSNDLFVTKLAADGSALVYSTYVGGSGSDYCWCPPLVDTGGSAYVVGSTLSSDFPTTAGCYDDSKDFSYDIVVCRVNSTGGNLTASTFIGGSWTDEHRAIAFASDGSIVVLGTSGSSDYPVTTGAFDTSHNGAMDTVVSILDPDLTELFRSTYLGGSSSEYCDGLKVDQGGTVCLGGYTESTDFPIRADFYDDTHNGLEDIFLARLSHDLSTLYNSTYIGGSHNDRGFSMDLDTSGGIYFTGYTYSSDFPTTSGSFDTSHNGLYDVTLISVVFPKVSDRDNDGVVDSMDAFPDNPYEYVDTDGDGMGDNLDPDADGDGIPDERDAFPLDRTESRDTDGDGTGDTADTDDDDDGVNDTVDAFPRNPNEFLDADGDGIGDRLDPDDDNDGMPDDVERWLAIRQEFVNVTHLIGLLNETISSDLADVNRSLHEVLSGLGSDFLDRLDGVNDTIGAEIGALMAAITTDLADLNATFDADLSDLGAWLDAVAAALEGQLAAVNSSLHSNLAGAEAATRGFFEELDRDLSGVMLQLMGTEGNLTAEVAALAALAGDLHETTLAELIDRLTTLSASVSEHDAEVGAKLSGMARNASEFEASTSAGLDATVDELGKLDAIIDDLATLDGRLEEAKDEVDASVEEASSEEMARLDVNMALTAAVIVLSVLLLALLMRMRRIAQGMGREAGGQES